MEEYTFIDCDGVIIDSEERMLNLKFERGYVDHHDEASYFEYFKKTETEFLKDWDYIIREAKSINNSVEIIRELESIGYKLAILTKIHTIYEMEVKIDDLRNNRKLKSPILFVPPKTNKHEIIIPNSQLLIDDSRRNVENWIKAGGSGYIFDKNLKEDSLSRVRSLEFLRRR